MELTAARNHAIFRPKRLWLLSTEIRTNGINSMQTISCTETAPGEPRAKNPIFFAAEIHEHGCFQKKN